MKREVLILNKPLIKKDNLNDPMSYQIFYNKLNIKKVYISYSGNIQANCNSRSYYIFLITVQIKIVS